MSSDPTRSSNLVQVDAYMIPEESAAQYIADRERLAAVAIAYMSRFCTFVERCWQGSEDGEAIVGLDEAGEIISMIHLDPDGVRLLDRPDDLQDYLRPDRAAH